MHSTLTVLYTRSGSWPSSFPSFPAVHHLANLRLYRFTNTYSTLNRLPEQVALRLLALSTSSLFSVIASRPSRPAR